MREPITFDDHRQHAWLHFAIRLAIVLLLIFLILVLSGKVVGNTQKAELTPAEVLEAEQLLIPMFAAKAFHDLTPVGTIVVVFDRKTLIANSNL